MTNAEFGFLCAIVILGIIVLLINDSVWAKKIIAAYDPPKTAMAVIDTTPRDFVNRALEILTSPTKTSGICSKCSGSGIETSEEESPLVKSIRAANAADAADAAHITANSPKKR